MNELLERIQMALYDAIDGAMEDGLPGAYLRGLHDALMIIWAAQEEIENAFERLDF